MKIRVSHVAVTGKRLLVEAVAVVEVVAAAAAELEVREGVATTGIAELGMNMAETAKELDPLIPTIAEAVHHKRLAETDLKAVDEDEGVVVTTTTRNMAVVLKIMDVILRIMARLLNYFPAITDLLRFLVPHRTPSNHCPLLHRPHYPLTIV